MGNSLIYMDGSNGADMAAVFNPVDISNLIFWLERDNPGSGATWNDAGSNNLDGTISGADWASGYLNFVRASGDYVNMGDISQVDFGSGDFAIVTRIYPTTIDNGTRMMIAAKDAAGGRQFEFGINEAAASGSRGALFCEIWSSNDIADRVIETTAVDVIAVDTWQTVVAQRNGNDFEFYVNNSADITSAVSAGSWPRSMQATGTNLNIGRRAYGGFEDNFNGRISDILFYGQSLTAGEIDDLMTYLA